MQFIKIKTIIIVVLGVFVLFLVYYFSRGKEEESYQSTINRMPSKVEIGEPDTSFICFLVCDTNSVQEIRDIFKEFSQLFLDSTKLFKCDLISYKKYFILSVPSQISLGKFYNLVAAAIGFSSTKNTYFGVVLCPSNTKFSHYSLFLPGNPAINDFVLNKYQFGEEFGAYLPDESVSEMNKSLTQFPEKYLKTDFDVFLKSKNINERDLMNLESFKKKLVISTKD